MDFMKVLDQTVREIKREVNIKVLKVPEIEQKVLDATSNEPWGPHGTDLTEIAQATKKFTECQLIMTTLWTRLGDGGRSWRHVYKALSVIEYLVAHGSERALDDIIEHTFQISSLSSFEFVEPNGKDVGINIRKKAETITGLLSNKDKIQEVRDKAAANRDKYFGLSSTGITYKSSTASTGFGSGSFQPSDRYGGASKKEGEMFKDRYSDRARSGRDEYKKDSRGEGNSSKKASSHYRSRSEDASLSSNSKAPSGVDNSHDKHGTIPSETSAAQENLEDDFDDFDPRGTSTAGAAATNVNQVNLLDLMDEPATSVPEMSTVNGNATKEVDLFADAAFVSAPSNVGAGASFQSQVIVPEMSTTNSNATNEVDLFADAAFVSAPSNVGAGASFQSQDKADLFASQPAFTSSSSSTVDLFSASHTPAQSEFKSPKTETINNHAIDPFASMPLNNFDGTDLFGGFAPHTDQGSAVQNSAKEAGLSNTIPNPSAETKPSTKKNSFQVKSGIWADSLSRGIIDLNITAPKRADLTDLGIVGGLGDGSDEKEKGPPAMYMGRAMGTGSGLGRSASGFNSASAGIPDDFFSSLSQQNQFGSFQK